MSSKVFCNKNKYILGTGAVEELGTAMKENGVKKLLCVYGGGSVKTNGVYERIQKILKENGIECIELWGVQPNPVIAKVMEGVALLKDEKNGVDSVLAVGGGSVIDSAKAMCVGKYDDGEDFYDCFRRKRPFPKEMVPLYVILTLSATASENDVGGVITNPPTKEKLGPGYGTEPIACAVDPTIQFSLPWRQIMCGAVDTLTHLMETMYSLDGSWIVGRQINFAVQRSVYKAMEIIEKDPKNYAARENLCWAASLGLRGEAAFGNDQDWNVHHLEHVLSAVNPKTAHAEGLAALGPHYYAYMYNKGVCKESLDLWSKEVMGEEDFHKGLEKYKEAFLRWKAPAGLKEIGITTEAQVDELVSIYAHNRDLGFKSGVFLLTDEDAKAIYMEALKY